MRNIYLLKGSYQYQYGDPVEIVEEYFVSRENAYNRLESLVNECVETTLDVSEIECSNDELWDYYFEDEDELEEEEDEL